MPKPWEMDWSKAPTEPKPASENKPPWEQDWGGVAPKEEKYNNAESATQGFGNGLMLGYAPHAQAAVATGIDKGLIDGKSLLSALAGPGALATELGRKYFSGELNEDPRSYKDAYLQNRDQMIKRQDEMKKEDPISFGGGQVAGAVTGAVIPGAMLGKAAQGAQALSLGQRMLQGTKAGMAYGALANPGDTEGEMGGLQLGDRAKNSATGAAVGAALPVAMAAGKGALDTIGKGAKAVRDLSAYGSLGPKIPEAIKDIMSGRAQKMGDAMMSEGVVGLGSSRKAIADNLANVKPLPKDYFFSVRGGKTPTEMREASELLTAAKDIASKSSGSKSPVGLFDLAALASMGPKGLLLSGGKRLAQDRGASVLAHAGQGAMNAANKASGWGRTLTNLEQSNPMAFSALMQGLKQKSGFDQENVPAPEAIDRYLSGN